MRHSSFGAVNLAEAWRAKASWTAPKLGVIILRLGWFGFHAWYGFLTCAAMIVFAKCLGLLIKRPDTYYGEDR